MCFSVSAILQINVFYGTCNDFSYMACYETPAKMTIKGIEVTVKICINYTLFNLLFKSQKLKKSRNLYNSGLFLASIF